MAREFRLADIGEGLIEAEIVSWMVSVGDQVTVDQPLVEVETAKSMVELPSPFAGTVLHLGGPDGGMLKVGEIIAVVGEPGETWPPTDAGAGPATAPPTAQAAPAAEPSTHTPSTHTPSTDPPPSAGASSAVAPIIGNLSEEAQDLTPVATPARAAHTRVRALPPVRKLAKDLGVDLGTVTGTGPQGTITRDDVTAAASSPRSPADPRQSQRGTTQPSPNAESSGSPSSSPGLSGPGSAGSERRPLSQLRRTIAAELSRAWSEIPLVSAFDDMDVGRLLTARKALADHYGKPIPMDALFVAAVLPVLRAFPEFNSSLDGDTLVLHRRQDVGIAVDTPNGLMVAVIADAGSMGLVQLADEVTRLGKGARARTLTRKELTGQTFTVSNIGAIGGGGCGTPLVPPGTTAIVSLGRASDKPVVRDARIEIAPMMPVSLSFDHRVIDGGMGRRFLAMLTEQLSEPVRLLG